MSFVIPSNRIIKYLLPDGNDLIIHAKVVNTFLNHIQKNSNDPESGGFLLGYENSRNNSIVIENITLPQENDRKSSIYFLLRDSKHISFIEKAKIEKSFFLGSWHTHPEDNITPSVTDWEDWKKSRKKERPGARYMVFIIVGRKEIGVWSVDIINIFGKITKLVKKVGDEI